MARYQIRNLEDDSIATYYEADEPQQFGGPWGNSDLYIHELQPIQEVEEAARQEKWRDLRRTRDQKLALDVDKARWNMTWAEQDSQNASWTQADKDAWAAYRTALLDVPQAIVDIDAIDLATYVWPTKPTMP